jgi:metal-dependent amidase/aminoacylase/carboxypeptidase family protein
VTAKDQARARIAAHAAAYPELGVNAADAFTIAQVAIGLLRQQLPASVRVHGIVTHAGHAPNAIPGHAEGRWYVRAASLAELDRIEPRIRACFQAGAGYRLRADHQAGKPTLRGVPQRRAAARPVPGQC